MDFRAAMTVDCKSLQIRSATSADVSILASMNRQLIEDEGHRNPMTLIELTERMAGWLSGEYEAVLFELKHRPVGYMLFLDTQDYVYLRQIYVVPEMRRRGFAREALKWLWESGRPDAQRLRIDVLIGNRVGQAFWRSCGLTEYALAMEAQRPR